MRQEGYELIKEVYLLLDDGDLRFLRQHGLTQVQYYALLWLAEEPMSMKQLSRHLLCDPSNITRVATIMERKGLLARRREPQDRRVVRLELTATGRQLYRKVRQTHDAYVLQRMAVLNEAEQANLLALLRKLSSGLRQQLPDAEI